MGKVIEISLQGGGKPFDAEMERKFRAIAAKVYEAAEVADREDFGMTADYLRVLAGQLEKSLPHISLEP